MTPERAVELVGRWPKDRSVPRQLAAGIKQASGETRRRLGMLVEALQAASKTQADLELIEKYFG